MNYTALLTPIEDIGCLLLSARPTAQTRVQIWSREQRLMRWLDDIHVRQQDYDRRLACAGGWLLSLLLHAGLACCLAPGA